MGQRKLLFLAPGLLWLILLVLLPLLVGFFLSFNEYSFIRNTMSFVGFENYARALEQFQDNELLSITLMIAVASSVTSLLLGAIAAVVFAHDLPLVNLLRPLFTTPLAVAPFIAGTLSRAVFNSNYGLIRGNLLVDPSLSAVSIILVDTWLWTPAMCFLIIAFARRIKARGNGFGSDAALPNLPLAWLALFLLRLSFALTSYALPYVMTGGGPGYSTTTLALVGVNATIGLLQPGYGAAVSSILLLLNAVLLGLFYVILRRLPLWEPTA